MLFVGTYVLACRMKKLGNKYSFLSSSWSYIFQIEECQVKIQYRSHLIEFPHHIEGVQRFFINQVLSISSTCLSLCLQRIISDRLF